MRTLISIAAAVLASALCATAAPEKVLFVGNSYTGQVRAQVTKLFASTGHRGIALSFVTPGGRKLEQHVEEKDLLEKIAGGGWDVVVLQDQSQMPAVFPKRFLAASEKLHELIGKAGAETAYYQTWGRRDGDRQNAARFPTYEKMQRALTESYRGAARRDGAILVPVGEAWARVREERPDLGRALYKGDGSHPSAKGAYLAACCFYAALTGGDPRDLDFGGGLPDGEAEYLRVVAHEVCAAAARR